MKCCCDTQMKLAFLVQGLDAMSEWVPFAKEHGVPGVELMFGAFSEADSARAAEHKKLLEDNGVEICAIGLWRVNHLDPDPAKREANHAMLNRVFDYAATVDCPVVYTDTGQVNPDDPAASLAEYKKVFPSIIELAKSKGIRLANYVGHPGNFVNSKKALGWLYDQVPEIGLKLDPVGIIRNVKADPYEVIKDYGDRIVHFHVKDIMRLGGFEIEPPVGMGDLDWSRILALLYHHNYHGYIAIEPHGPQWAKGKMRARHILLSKRHIEQFLA